MSSLSDQDKYLVVKALSTRTAQDIFKADRPGLQRYDKKHTSFVNTVAAALGVSNADRDGARAEGKALGGSAAPVKAKSPTKKVGAAASPTRKRRRVSEDGDGEGEGEDDAADHDQ